MPSLSDVTHYHVAAPLLALRYHARPKGRWLELGSGHGRWWVPASIVRPGAVAYLGGAGGDISFDVDLYERGLVVRCFDPTPNSRRYVERVAPKGDRFTFVPVGWWSEKATIPMFAPPNPEDFSHSATNLWDTTEADQLPVDSVAGCMAALGDSSVDLVKIDVEGAEKEVLRGLLSDGVRPEALCVEFDPPVRTSMRMIHTLRCSGYTLGKVDGWNYTFVR